MPASDDAKNN